MIRIISTTALRGLRSELEQTRGDLDAARTEAASATEAATEAAIRAEIAVEDLLTQLGQDHVEHIRAERIHTERIRQLTRERDEARERADVAAEMRADIDRIRADATDTERGESVRGAIAYNALRHIYTMARSRGLEPGGPWDLIALVLDLDAEDPSEPDAVQEVAAIYWRRCAACGMSKPAEAFKVSTVCPECRARVDAAVSGGEERR